MKNMDRELEVYEQSNNLEKSMTFLEECINPLNERLQIFINGMKPAQDGLDAKGEVEVHLCDFADRLRKVYRRMDIVSDIILKLNENLEI